MGTTLPFLKPRAATCVKVLVAEDVAVNRALVRLFLEPRGYAVEAVEDGALALAAVQACNYDLVIMDMQMPVMDGLQATQAIRELGGRFTILPILGLSANVLPDQIERCLETGMSAHLCKPFDSQALVGAVERLVAETGARPAVSNPAFGRLPSHQMQILLNMLDLQIETFERGDHGDAEEVARQAHSLRGGAGVMGFADLAEACRMLEAARKDDDWQIALVAALRAGRAARRDIRNKIATPGQATAEV